MVSLIDHIDSILAEEIPGKYYGLAKLVKDDKGEPYPRTWGKEAKKITPDDKWKFLCYHRLLDGSFEDSEEFSFGRSPSRLNNQQVRLVIFTDIKSDEDEILIDKIIDLLPVRMEADDYKYAGVNTSVSLIRDSESIWETEFGNAYKDKYQMRYNVYAVEYSINYIACDECVNACETP